MTAARLGAILLLVSSLLFGATVVGLVFLLNQDGGWVALGALVSIVAAGAFGVGLIAAALLARTHRYPFDGASSKGIAVVAVAFGAFSIAMLIGTLATDPDVLLIPLALLLFVGFGGSLIGSVIIGVAWLRAGGTRRLIASVFVAAIGLALLGATSPASAGIAVVVGTGCWMAAAVLAIRHNLGATER